VPAAGLVVDAYNKLAALQGTLFGGDGNCKALTSDQRADVSKAFARAFASVGQAKRAALLAPYKAWFDQSTPSLDTSGAHLASLQAAIVELRKAALYVPVPALGTPVNDLGSKLDTMTFQEFERTKAEKQLNLIYLPQLNALTYVDAAGTGKEFVVSAKPPVRTPLATESATSFSLPSGKSYWWSGNENAQDLVRYFTDESAGAAGLDRFATANACKVDYASEEQTPLRKAGSHVTLYCTKGYRGAFTKEGFREGAPAAVFIRESIRVDVVERASAQPQ
jgi:hypothetical protein